MAAAALLCGLPADSFAVEESTVEQLKELQELRKEVDRRRSEMRVEPAMRGAIWPGCIATRIGWVRPCS